MNKNQRKIQLSFSKKSILPVEAVTLHYTYFFCAVSLADSGSTASLPSPNSEL